MNKFFDKYKRNPHELHFNEEKYSCLESKILELNYALIGDIPKNNIDEIIRKEKEEYMQKFNVISLQYTPEILKTLLFSYH
jgi:hypothetical protein